MPRLEHEKAHVEGELMKAVNALSQREAALSEVCPTPFPARIPRPGLPVNREHDHRRGEGGGGGGCRCITCSSEEEAVSPCVNADRVPFNVTFFRVSQVWSEISCIVSISTQIATGSLIPGKCSADAAACTGHWQVQSVTVTGGHLPCMYWIMCQRFGYILHYS